MMIFLKSIKTDKSGSIPPGWSPLSMYQLGMSALAGILSVVWFEAYKLFLRQKKVPA
jgi:hypothetical protein